MLILCMPSTSPDLALDLNKKRRGRLYLLVPRIKAFHSPHCQKRALTDTHVKVHITSIEP